jgi:hypothetical protein
MGDLILHNKSNEMNTTNTTVAEPVARALALLRQGQPHAAHMVLAEVYRAHPILEEAGRIANMIEPCEMIRESRLRLAQLLDRLREDEIQCLKSKVESLAAEYSENPPRDADIGRLVGDAV